ncbi:MAG: gliding motility-associated C-terminal domain-containing protein [Bacteroidota bacterium]
MNLPLKIKLASLFLCLCLAASAQEICDNGIDDDGDNLIDLNDTTDCACSIPPIVESLLPNPSFDQFTNDADCESNQPNGAPDGLGQANCLGGWIRASNTTTDAWHLITLPGAPPFWPSSLPQPIPSGVGAAGFYVGLNQNITDVDGSIVDGADYREYLGACFDEEGLIAGEEYQLDFFLGLAEATFQGPDSIVYSPLPLRLSLYGITNCDQIPYEGIRCPELSGAEGWTQVAEIVITDGDPDTWQAVSTSFISPDNYEAFAIGGSCDGTILGTDFEFWRNYYFVDELRLNRASEFEQPTIGPIAVAADDICDDDAEMVAPDIADADYQWYRNGVAIDGATGQTYWPPQDEDFNGQYTVRVTTDQGCGIAEEVDLIRPVITNAFADSVQWCDGIFSLNLTPSGLGTTFNDAYAFVWDDGSTFPTRQIFAPGTYSVTITAFCEELIETIEVVEGILPTYEITIEPEDDCFADTILINFESNFFWQGVLIANDVTFEQRFGQNPFILTQEDLADPWRLIASNQCFLIDEPLDLPQNNFELDVSVTPAVCETLLGSATVTTSASDPIYEWRDQNGVVVGMSEELVAPPGDYELSVVTSFGCETVEQVSIPPPNNQLAVTEEIDEPSCFGGSGSISVVPTGGSAYTYQWLDEDGQPLGNEASLDIAEAGRYTLVLTSGLCSISETYEVGFDTGIEFEVQVQDERCGDDGTADLVVTDAPTDLSVAWFEQGSNTPISDDNLSVGSLSPGTYRVELTAVAGCTAVEEFTVVAGTPIEITSEVGVADCASPTGANLTIVINGGTPPYEYQLDGGPTQIEPTFFDLPNGIYEISVTDVFGCAITAESPEIILPEPIFVEAGPDLEVDLGEFVAISTTASGGTVSQATISWSPPDGLSCTDCPRPLAEPVRNTVYTISYTDPIGCIFSDSVLVRVDPTGRVFIPNAFSPNFDGRNDNFELYTDRSIGQVVELKVYDRWGGQRYAYDLTTSDLSTLQDRPRWDGSCGREPCAMGIYVYFAKVRLLNGEELDFAGDVMLLR